LGEINIADGPNQTGHLSAYNGSAWVGTEDWRKGASGTTLPILKLLTNETLALHVRPIEQYNGNVISSSLFGQRFVWDSTAYIMTSGTFTANDDEWSMTLYKIQTIRTAVTALDELPVLVERTPLPGATTTGGSSPNDIVAGRVAGMLINTTDEKIGPFEQTATGAKINGTTEVTGAATFDDAVDVVGDTTLAKTNITGVATMERSTIIGLESFVDTFETRVTTDGGVVESKTCVSDAITALVGENMVSLIPTDISAPLTAAEAVVVKKTLDVDGATTMGSTLDVDGRTATSYVQLDTAFVPNGEPAGALYWDPDGAVAAVRGIDGISLDLNEKEIWFVKNQTGAPIGAGVAVYAAGTLGSSGQVLIAKMIADGTINAKFFLGITQATIDNGGDGYVVRNGKIRGLNTSVWNDGDVLYVDENTAGALSDTEPQAPNLKLPVAFVINSSSTAGTIAVRQTTGTYLAESHDVQIGSPAENEILARTASGRWENVEIGSVLTTTTEKPEAEGGESFTQAFGTNSGTIMGEPDKWLPITIGGVNYLMPLYAAP
jgi:hypothetical protein